MNWLVLSAVLALAAFSTAEQYTDRYDDMNVDEIIDNHRLMDAYVKCMLDEGKCTAEGKELKAHLVDAMKTGCEKCTAKQKQKARKVGNHLKEKKTGYWNQLKAKYDPDEKYKPIYEPFFAGHD